jgi:hypothetical protein
VIDPSHNPVWVAPPPAGPLVGTEPFLGLDASVADFWRWAFSDLRGNTLRGVFAEYLVARAVGDPRPLRVDWGNNDVCTRSGVTIEVKCSAYIQSWRQRRASVLTFGRLAGREYDEISGTYSTERRVRADVFVFAVQTQREPAEYDIFDLGHWRFWVATADAVRARIAEVPGTKNPTVGKTWLRQNAAGPVSYPQLAAAVEKHGTAVLIGSD